jgi:hypothetical protein
MDCPACDQPLRLRDGAECSRCKATIPEAWATSPERRALAEATPKHGAIARRPMPQPKVWYIMSAFAMAIVVEVGFVWAVAGDLFTRLVMGGTILVGQIVGAALFYRMLRKPVTRAVAVVVALPPPRSASRAAPRQVTLELTGGERRELITMPYTAAWLAPAAIGVATIQGRRLSSFDRLDE